MHISDDIFRAKLHALYEADKIQEALDLVEEELSRKPEEAAYYTAKALTLSRLGRYEEAIKAADEAIAREPEDAETHYIRGMDFYDLRKPEEAIASFDACLALNPHHPIAIQKKIYALVELGRYDEAVRAYEYGDLPELLEGNWLNTLGYAYLEIGKHAAARAFFHKSFSADPFAAVVHYNLARIYKRSKHFFRYILHKVFFWTLLALENNPGWKEKRIKRPKPHITEATSFGGSGALFSSPSQDRELRTILKLLRDFNAMALCNDTWQWFAVNIPYDAVEKNAFRGDIDIILKRPRYFGSYDAGFTYRGFQVKVVQVDKNGNIKSAKRGVRNLNLIKKQLDVQQKFGCEQIFFLEIFVLERGYSNRNNFPSKGIQKEIIEKERFLEPLGYGYVVMAEEPLSTHHEEAGGVAHLPLNILPAKSNPIGDNFQKLVDGIDAFLEQQEIQDLLAKLTRKDAFGSKVGYCSNCKNLTMLARQNTFSHVCIKCHEPAY